MGQLGEALQRKKMIKLWKRRIFFVKRFSYLAIVQTVLGGDRVQVCAPHARYAGLELQGVLDVGQWAQDHIAIFIMKFQDLCF